MIINKIYVGPWLPANYVILPGKEITVLLDRSWQNAPPEMVYRLDEHIRYKHRTRQRCKYWFLKLFSPGYRKTLELSAFIWELNAYIKQIKKGKIKADKSRVFGLIPLYAKRIHSMYPKKTHAEIVKLLYTRINLNQLPHGY